MNQDGGAVDSIWIQRTLPGKRWQVFRLISNIESLPQHMPNVKEAKVLEKTRQGSVTEWFVDIDGLPVHWKQEDSFDFATFSIHFRAVEGDLEEFEGRWILKQGQGNSTDVILEVKARLGIPLFEHVVGDLIKQKLRRNFEMMFSGMENRLLDHRYELVDGKRKSTVKGFVVMGHPYNYKHLVKFFKVFKPDLDKITPEFLMKIFELAPSYRGADIKGFRSATGKVVDGYYVMCPIIPDMALLSPEIVLPKVLEGCKIGERLGAGILALGGFTSIVGERYFDRLKSEIKIPVTTGNALTTVMTLAGIRKASKQMQMDLSRARACIIGGTGDIGSACARVLAREVAELVVTGRTPGSVTAIEKQLNEIGGAKIEASLDNNKAVINADIVIACASSSQSVVDIKYIKPGAVVCDVGYPKNISYQSQVREDIFVFSGGLTGLPTPFDLGFDLGLPSKDILYGCFAEAIVLSLEERFENFSEGKGKLMPEKISEMEAIATKHGFHVAPFFWGNQLISEKMVEQILSKARSVKS